MGVEVGGMSGESGDGRFTSKEDHRITKQMERHKNCEFKTSRLVHRIQNDDLTATGKTSRESTRHPSPIALLLALVGDLNILLSRGFRIK